MPSSGQNGWDASARYGAQSLIHAADPLHGSRLALPVVALARLPRLLTPTRRAVLACTPSFPPQAPWRQPLATNSALPASSPPAQIPLQPDAQPARRSIRSLLRLRLLPRLLLTPPLRYSPQLFPRQRLVEGLAQACCDTLR